MALKGYSNYKDINFKLSKKQLIDMCEKRACYGTFKDG